MGSTLRAAHLAWVRKADGFVDPECIASLCVYYAAHSMNAAIFASEKTGRAQGSGNSTGGFNGEAGACMAAGSYAPAWAATGLDSTQIANCIPQAPCLCFGSAANGLFLGKLSGRKCGVFC